MQPLAKRLSRFNLLRVSGALAFLLLTTLHAAEIPGWTIESTVSASAPERGRADWHAATELVHRWPWGANGWSIGVGAGVERFTFGPQRTGCPRRLESVAAPLALEYFQHDESVAGVVVRPGRYVADGSGGSSWDAPVDALAGFPLGGGWNGVVGFSAGRFYHHPLPIAGVVWEPGPRVRVEAVYPEPAVVVKLARATLRVGGEVVGGGFHRDASTPGGRSVEYFAYRVGAALSFQHAGCTFTPGAGLEVRREFEFASGRASQRQPAAAFLNLTIAFRR